jgi:hypothetical protein
MFVEFLSGIPWTFDIVAQQRVKLFDKITWTAFLSKKLAEG